MKVGLMETRPASTLDVCLAEPLHNVGRGEITWNRYKPFQLRCTTNTKHHYGGFPTYGPADKFTFVPYHKSYEKIWSAIKYGYYAWLVKAGGANTVERFVLDMFTGEIVWQNYNKKKPTYFYKEYGVHY